VNPLNRINPNSQSVRYYERLDSSRLKDGAMADVNKGLLPAAKPLSTSSNIAAKRLDFHA
jgi:hypothetical protein